MPSMPLPTMRRSSWCGSAVADRWWQALLPLHAVTLEMRFSEACTPGFFHQAALTAWLRRLLGSPDDYDLHLSIDTPEQGRRHYRAGDRYRFTVLAVGDTGTAWLGRLVTHLHGGSGGPRWDSPMPFRNNWRLERLFSWPEGEELSSAEALPAIDAATIARQVDSLRGESRLSLRLVSPWRVLREKQHAGGRRGELRFCRDSDHLHRPDRPLWLQRIGDALRDLARRRGETVPARGETPALAARADLFWVNAAYRDREGNEKPMGGLLGRIDIDEPDTLSEAQLYMLVLGQYLGVGQRRAFGLGRYQLLTADGRPLFRRAATLPLLEQAMQPENLVRARASILAGTAEDADEEVPREEDVPAGDSDDEAVAELAVRLLRGHYQPPPLNGFVHEDADGGLRPLAAPPIRDRILQRAVHQSLSPLLDGIMDHGSYGFRAGRSRYQVRDLIQRLYREGYRWVFESDVRSFFDTVTWPRLRVRLESLLGDEPVVDAVLAWMRAPVRWQGRLVERLRGLPQGSPLSPVLANMMLDDFDHDLRHAGCQLIRFADDFVIVAKSRQAAEAGGERARRALLDTGLTLNEEKTRVVPFSEGFRFLGFLFVDGLAVESKPERSADAGKPPPQSWLARVAVSVDESADEGRLRGCEAVPLAPYSETGRLLIFCGEPAMLFSRAGSLCIERQEELLHRAPWGHLGGVVLFGRHQITTPALHEAMRWHVPVHMASGSGRYLGAAVSGKAGADQAALWLAQQQRFSDDAWALAAAGSVVDARIRHMAENLRRRGGVSDSLWRSGFEQALRRAAGAGGREELNGVEGSAARLYFEVLRQLLPEEFGFAGRNRRPPRDPFNALLSLGYTLLYSHVDTLLRADGLLPVAGFYHRSHGAHSALASDLMEPFRHLVEREALNMLCGRRLRADDFTVDEQGCRLAAPARRLYLAALSGTLLKPLKGRGGEPLSPLEHIHSQNVRLKFALVGKAAAFEAWRMR